MTATANAPSTPRSGPALLALGFRPFYLLAGAYAALAVPLWLAQHAGALATGSPVPGFLWHAHEMIFGYTFAVIAGFLFTAVRNWTNAPTPAGGALAFVCALWIAARVFVFTPWTLVAAALDVAFAVAVAIGIGRPLAAAGNRRNYFFVALVLVLGAAGATLLLAANAGRMELAQAGIGLGLDLVTLIIAVMAGRVVPMFTNNAVPGADAGRIAWVERIALASLVALAAADVAGLPRVAGAVALVAALAHGIRLWRWHPWRTLCAPILWILHVSYAWLVLHLALRAGGAFDLVAPNLAVHALTVGAIGGITLGMMTRTARGHTGRMLVAGRAEVAAYVLVQLAAAARVFLPMALPAAYMTSLTLSAALWSAAFALFTARFWPILTQQRADGRPG